MIKIAILADIHANLPAFQAILADAETRGCSRVYHAGDLITIGPYPAEVVDLALSVNLTTVKGNHEMWVDCGLPLDPNPVMDDGELLHQHWTHSRLDKRRREYIRAMPHAIDEVLEGVRLHIVHFAREWGASAFKAVDPAWTDQQILTLFGDIDVDLLCFGHLHNRLFSQLYRGVYFLNPGPAGCNHKGIAPYATVTIEDTLFAIEHHAVSYDRGELLSRYDRLEIPARNDIRRIFFGIAD